MMCRVVCQHVACRVENTRVNPDSLIDELLAATDLKHAVDDSAESKYTQYTSVLLIIFYIYYIISIIFLSSVGVLVPAPDF